MSNPSITADKTPWYQWDTGLTVNVSCGAMTECHFANRKQGTAYVQAVINGVARVPDELLQVAAPIKAYGYVSDGAGGQTYVEQTFEVIARNIPADYTYTKTAQKTIRDAEAARDQAVQAAKDAKASELAADDSAVEASKSAQSAGESASAAATSASNAAKSASDAASVGDKTLNDAKKYTDANTTNALVGTVSGKLLHVEDAWPYKPLSLTIEGAYKQDGTPSPENPVPIEVIENPVVKVTGRNVLRLKPNLEELTVNGITFTPTDGGGIRIKGTATNIAFYNIDFGGVSYSLVPFIGQRFYYKIPELKVGYWDVSGNQGRLDTGNAVPNTARVWRSFLQVDDKVTVDKTVYPYVTIGDDAGYALYTSATLPITLPAEHPYLAKLPDGTHDEIVIDKYGNATLVARVGKTETAAADGVNATIGTDALSSTGALADGATVYYKLATNVTYNLGKLDIPALPETISNVYVSGELTPECSMTYKQDVNIVVRQLQQAIAAISTNN